MGFLTGAFGKLMAGKYLRSLQHRATMVQSRLRRVTREVGQMEKMFASQEKQIKSSIAYQQQQMILPYQTAYFNAIGNYGTDYNDEAKRAAAQNAMQIFSYQQQQIQMFATMSQSAWEQAFEMQKESMLQPLKDLEDDLQTEKDNLESQIKIAQAEYDAKKEEEKAGAKNMAPDYTGQG